MWLSMYRMCSSLFAGRGLFVLVIAAFAITTITLRAPDVISLLASASSSVQRNTVLFFSSNTRAPASGDLVTVDVDIDALTPVNAAGVSIRFSRDYFDVVSISKATSILDLWTEETTIDEDSGEVHFSGGTIRRGGFIGTGTLLTITLRAKQSGSTQLDFTQSEVLASDGFGNTVPVDARSLRFEIQNTTPLFTEPSTSLPVAQSTTSIASGTALVDVSILTLHLLGTFSPRYDINGDGFLNLRDLSSYFSLFRFPR